MISGRLPLVWAHAQVVYDSPDKKKVENGAMVGRLMERAVANATREVQSELLMVTPYLIPGKEGMQLFKDLRQRNVRVRILTSSLESSTVLLAQAGYMHYRVPLLEDGVELYEIRSLLGNTRGSGQTAAISRFGNYSLHAKLFVFDRKRLFIGSMNFDQRSMHLNTEIGLIIDSPELAQQIAARFEAMVQPANSYMLALRPNAAGERQVWCGAPRKTAKPSSTTRNRPGVTGKESRSIFYRCCHWIKSYEHTIDAGLGADAGTLVGTRCACGAADKCASQKSIFCLAMSRDPDVSFIATAPGTTQKRRKRICATSTNTWPQEI